MTIRDIQILVQGWIEEQNMPSPLRLLLTQQLAVFVYLYESMIEKKSK